MKAKEAFIGGILALACLAGCSPVETTNRAEGTSSPTTATQPAEAVPDSDAPLVLLGETTVVSKVPEPDQAPYRECLMFVKYRVLSVEKGDYKAPEIVAAHWGMKGKKLTPAARYRVGEKHRLELAPLSERPELERVMQADETEAVELTPYYVLKVEEAH